MADFLLELFSEEIPARMQPAAASQLAERFRALLDEAGLEAGSIETHATPRRLALIARGLPAASEATAEERRGPRADAPEKAIDGFLKSTGLSRDQLEERDTGKGVFLFAVIRREGRPTADILAEKLPGMIAGFQWPKSQRWGTASQSTASPRWVRPLRGILALLDADVVPFEALGLTSGRTTFGHRFMGGADPIAIDSPSSYEAQLEAAFVVLSMEERRARIREGAQAAAEAEGLVLRPDEGLEAENAGLTEWPVPLLGRFDPAFLDVPPEIIQLTMRTNQKYFAVEDAGGALAPAFVCVSNLVAPDGGRTIVAGNERVLSARLSDAKFFWANDKATPLESFGERLKDIVFHEKLGTMAEKIERVAKLACWLVESGAIRVAQVDEVERAARLAKADLTTGTVGEFPELQGIIGGYLAEAQGEKPEIVSALKQQYLPVPSGHVPVALALADRLDTLGQFFAADIKPTGSKDPFALRRATLGTLRMLRDEASALDLFGAMQLAMFGRKLDLANETNSRIVRPLYDLQEFFADRFEQLLRDEGGRADLVRAVLPEGDMAFSVRTTDSAVRALGSFLQTEDGKNLLAGYKRAANILRIEEKKDGTRFAPAVDAGQLADDAERALDAALTHVAGAVETAVAAEDFAAAMQALATLRPHVDRFFDTVTVNAEDSALRANRLSLLAKLRETAHLVADFSKIEG